jgi:uncharacterized membrane protein YhaH (DUF805 family)
VFGAKYSRLKFWIISIIILTFLSQYISIAKSINMGFSYYEDAEATLVGSYIFIVLFTLIYINTLANRIRDYGGKPWYALWSLVPFVNIAMLFYYGLIPHKKTINKFKNNVLNSSLLRAFTNHTKDTVCNLKPKINEYIEKHSETICNEYSLIDNEAYETALNEIEQNQKIKSIWAKAYSKTNGDENKAKALYISLRVQDIKLNKNNK